MLFGLLILFSELTYKLNACLGLEFPAGLEHWLCAFGDFPVEVLKLYVKDLTIRFLFSLDVWFILIYYWEFVLIKGWRLDRYGLWGWILKPFLDVFLLSFEMTAVCYLIFVLSRSSPQPLIHLFFLALKEGWLFGFRRNWFYLYCFVDCIGFE